MKKLLRFLKPYKKESILGPLFKLLEASFELFVPLVVAHIIDVGIANQDRSVIVNSCLVLVALGIIGLICAVTAQFFAAKAAVGFAKHVRHALFEHIGKLSYQDLDRMGTSTLITRMTSDVGQVQSGINLTLRLLLRSPFVVLGAAVMAFTVDTRAALTFAVTIPLLSLAVFGIMFGCIPLYRRVQTRLDAITKTTRENLGGVRVLRAFRREAQEIASFDEKNEQLTKTQIHVGRISALLNPLSLVMVNLAIVVLIYVGALRVDAGDLSRGEVIALYNYMSQILVELIKFASLVITLTKAIACGNRLQAVLESEPSMTDKENARTAQPQAQTPVVSFDHVTMQYPGSGAPSLVDVTFDAYAGQTIGIIGGTGSGKTTLINLIPRFYDVTQGCVSVHGLPVTEWNSEALREQIGIVPQKAVLFQGSIRDNLRWGKQDATDEHMLHALELAQAGNILDGKENGLDSVVEQGGRNFSGGQRQRLTIARALVRQPQILILDDSSSALDYATDAALRRAIHRLPGDPVVFIVSQRTASLAHADQIIVLEDGEVAGIGTHDTLLRECETYREIYQSQFKREEAQA